MTEWTELKAQKSRKSKNEHFGAILSKNEHFGPRPTQAFLVHLVDPFWVNSRVTW